MMHKEMDGLITETEREKLHRYLEAVFEAKKYYAQLCQTSELLDNIPRLEPSPNIKKYVMNSIDVRRYATSRKPLDNKSLYKSLSFKSIIRPALAFSLGILVGIFIYSGIRQQILRNTADVSNLYGSMGVSAKPQFETIRDISIALPEINGTIAVKRLENNIEIQTNLNSQHIAEMLVEYDTSFLEFVRFTLANRTKATFAPGEHDVRVSSPGDLHFSLSFAELDSGAVGIIVHLFVDGTLRLSQDILF